MYTCIQTYIYAYIYIYICNTYSVSAALAPRQDKSHFYQSRRAYSLAKQEESGETSGVWPTWSRLGCRSAVCPLRWPGTLVLPVEVRCYMSCFIDITYETPDVTPCRTSPPMMFCAHVTRETPDVTPCRTSPPQGVVAPASRPVMPHCTARGPRTSPGRCA